MFSNQTQGGTLIGRVCASHPNRVGFGRVDVGMDETDYAQGPKNNASDWVVMQISWTVVIFEGGQVTLYSCLDRKFDGGTRHGFGYGFVLPI